MPNARPGIMEPVPLPSNDYGDVQMEEYIEFLQKMLEEMKASSDTDSDPMSMLSSDKDAQDNLDDMNSASTANKAGLDSSAGMSLDAESAAMLAI